MHPPRRRIKAQTIAIVRTTENMARSARLKIAMLISGIAFFLLHFAKN